MKKIAYIGVDYHLNVLAIAVMIENTKKTYETIRLKNHDNLISKYLKKLSDLFELRIYYEASFSGYSFQRKVMSWGYHCDVIAPSLIPKKPGNRRKNDFRDAKDLVQNYANGLLTVVHPPSEEEESIRNLIRARIAFKEDEKRVKQRINSLLLSQDIHWAQSKWTKRHRDWLCNLQMPNRYLQEVLNEHLAHLDYLDSCLRYLDDQIQEIACSDIYAPSVKKLQAFKGIGMITAMVLIAEITDFRRFPNPKSLMAFLGLIPSENSSGDKQKGQGITRAGNSRCRKYLIEAVQCYPRSPPYKLSNEKRFTAGRCT
jgi:transposase